MVEQSLRWYVIQSKYRSEALLWQQLRSQYVEVYYPRICVWTVKRGIRKEKPYFPGYMFIRVDLDVPGRSRLEWVPGARGLVSFGGEPAYVSDNILYAIRERVDRMNSMRADPSQGLESGQELEIHTGPFAGYRGIFGFHLSDRERAIVFLRFVRDQQTRVELPVSDIIPAKQCQSRL